MRVRRQHQQMAGYTMLRRGKEEPANHQAVLITNRLSGAGPSSKIILTVSPKTVKTTSTSTKTVPTPECLVRAPRTVDVEGRGGRLGTNWAEGGFQARFGASTLITQSVPSLAEPVRQSRKPLSVTVSPPLFRSPLDVVTR